MKDREKGRDGKENFEFGFDGFKKGFVAERSAARVYEMLFSDL